MITFDLSLQNVYRQYYYCRRNKRNTINALRFETEQEKHLIDLQQALLNRRYQPGRSVCFFATRPKLREIFAADFRDRVVHHLLVDYLEKIWEPIFIHDSYACRKGKGVHGGVQRLQTFIRSASNNGTRPVWYLQLDIRNYFMSIDKDILFAQLKDKIKDETALWLTQLLVYHNCTDDYVMRGNPALMKAIPSHKTLFGCEVNKGLPIGNLNSQFFANVYLNALDQLVKHNLKCKHYLRYCDDFILVSHDKNQLENWRQQITDFLQTKLKLELNPRQILLPASNGVNFLGYIVRRDYLLVRRRVVNNLKVKLHQFETQLVSESKGYRYYSFDERLLNDLAATLSSYLGHFKLANSWNLWKGLWKQFLFLAVYFDFDVKHWKLIRKKPAPKGLQVVRQQYRYYRWCFPNDALLFRVGRFIEFYDIGNPVWLTLLGLKPMSWNRRGVRYGFPLTQFRKKLDLLLSSGIGVILIGESISELGGIRRRVPLFKVISI